MAVIPLGSQLIEVGQPFAFYTPFSYDQTLAYGIALGVEVDNPSSIFSFLRARFFVSVPNQAPFFAAEYVDLDIFDGFQLIWFPCSPLFRGDGTLTLALKRIPFAAGAGDGQPVTVDAFYDDEITVPSWRA